MSTESKYTLAQRMRALADLMERRPDYSGVDVLRVLADEAERESAAAPDLLDALRDLMELEHDTGNINEEWHRKWKDAVHRADAAIDKVVTP